MSKPLRSASATISAPWDRVVDLVFGMDIADLLAVMQGAAGMDVSGGPDRFEARSADGHTVMSVDLMRESRTVRIQGQWWYRGEYSFEPRQDHTVLTYRIYNLARVPDLMIKLWQWPLLRRQKRDTEALAQALGNRVG